MSKIKLHTYQEDTKNFILKNEKSALFLPMGYGKTSTTLKALEELRENNKIGNILVIAPKNIALNTWIDEIDFWDFNIEYESLITEKKLYDDIDIEYKSLISEKKLYNDIKDDMFYDHLISQKEMMEKYKNIFETSKKGERKLYIINKDRIAYLIEHAKDVSNVWPFDTLVIDESQSFKSQTSKRFKALKKILPATKRIILLSGTPAPNGLLDIWSQIYILDRGKRLEKSMNKYKLKYFKIAKIINNIPVKFTPLEGSEEEIYKKISDITMSMQNNKVKLPELIVKNFDVHLSQKEKKIYDNFKKDLVLELGDDLLIAKNRAVLINKLTQLSSGAIYLDDKHNYYKFHEKKLEALEYILDNTPTPSLIAYYFKSDLDMIKKYMEKKKIPIEIFDGSPQTLKRWNEGKIKNLLIHPASAGHGLNFQKGGHTLIWYTLSYNLEHYLQTNARLYRQGQKHNTTIIHITTKGCTDKIILNALNKKEKIQDELLKAIDFDNPILPSDREKLNNEFIKIDDEFLAQIKDL